MNDIFKLSEKYKIALDAAQICIFGVDLIKQKYLFFDNPEIIYNRSEDEILEDIKQYSRLSPPEYQKAVSEYFTHPDDHPAVSDAFAKVNGGRPATYYARMRSDKKYIWCKVDIMPIIRERTPVYMLGVISHLDRLINQKEEYRQQAMFDIPTALYNKNHFRSKVEEALLTEKNGALILIDIDDFKNINDTLGHFEGDIVLTKFSNTLRNIFTDGIIGRFGGDEFAVFLRNASRSGSLTADFIQRVNYEMKISVSAGIVICNKEDHNYDTYFIHADNALYKAKSVKNTYKFYD